MKLKKVVLWALAVVAAIVAVLVVAIAMQPAEFRLARSTTVAAPPAAVFAQVNDFRHWAAWSPWAKLDPNMKSTFEGPPAGAGSIYTWSGNDAVGEGRMTILDSRPSELVKIDLQFIKPFASTALAEFSFRPAAGGTEVTWAMSGQNNFMSKAIQMFCSMDKLLGGEFEKGLAQLKAAAESPAADSKKPSAPPGSEATPSTVPAPLSESMPAAPAEPR
jgi:hypothetical protein